MATQRRQGAERAKVEGCRVIFDRQDVVELGGCDRVWLVYLLVWDRPAVQNQRHKSRGWAPPFCRVGKVASGDQD